jgi:uncharacterized membrane protein
MNKSNTDYSHNKFQLDRIALFSDAVFAIAITLLVIEIKFPHIEYEQGKFVEAFWHGMKEILPEIIGFFISFIVIGSYWKAHHTIFGFVTDYNRKLININTWFLFTIVCMPFTTGIMSKYLHFHPYLIYCVNVITTGLLQIRIWHYVSNKKNNLCGTIPEGLKTLKYVSPMVVIGCFLLSILIYKFIGNLYALLFLISIFFIEIVIKKIIIKKYDLGKKY